MNLTRCMCMGCARGTHFSSEPDPPDFSTARESKTTTILYWSEDNGQLYFAENIDVKPDGTADGYSRYEVNDIVTLTPGQLCVQDGDILEALLASGQAKLVQP